MAEFTRREVTVGSGTIQIAECGQGPPLLLVHGFPLDHTMWRAQLAGLADSAHLIAPDLPGFGGSRGAVGETLTMQDLADSLAGLLDALGIDQPITFCGLSMGGYVALAFWQRHAERLARLILCDTRASADTPAAARNRHAVAEKVLREGVGPLAGDMAAKLFAPATAEHQPELVQSMVQVIHRTEPASVAAALRGMAARPDMSDQLGQIQLPTLVICGEQDVITTPEEMRRMAQAMPLARYLEIPAAGHMAPLEQPQPVNQAIRGFLTSG